MLWLLIIPAAAVAIALAARWLESIHYDSAYRRAFALFLDRRRKAGQSYAQTIDVLRLRTSMARVRRLASDDTLADPTRPLAHIRARIAAETEALMREHRALGQQFAMWTSGLGMFDILYPDAIEAIERQGQTERRARRAKPKVPSAAEAASFGRDATALRSTFGHTIQAGSPVPARSGGQSEDEMAALRVV